MSQDPAALTGITGEGKSFGIVASQYNQSLVDSLLQNVLLTLKGAGAEEARIETLRVPGSGEIPFPVSMLAKTNRFHCLIALGVIIAGETRHHEHIALSAGSALQHIATEYGTPVINGIILAETRDQAEARCLGDINRGKEFALAALAMADIKAKLSPSLAKPGNPPRAC